MFGIQGNIFSTLALLGYIPFIFVLFAFLKPRTAVIYNFLFAWLFLPMAFLSMPGFTSLNKMSLACVGTLLGALTFDIDTVLKFRFKVWDIPILVLCFCPFLSSRHNGYSLYDGFASIAYHTLTWGMPYLVGRLYFNDLKAMRELAVGIVVGGLLYAPLMWYEMRMSPQLHRIVYGFTQFDFSQSKRYGGWRPMVFMQTGLSVATWMSSAAVTAFWLWKTKVVPKVMGIKMGWVTLILVGTSLLDHSVGAVALMFLGMGVLWLTSITKTGAWALAIALIPLVWMAARIPPDFWTGQGFEDFVRQYDKRSADSIHVRLHSERKLVDRALEEPVYGWTGYKFNVNEQTGKILGIPDQMWVIMFGKCGFIGLISMTVAMLLPMPLLMWKIAPRYWGLASTAPAAALAMLVTLHMCDMLFNAMVNPIFLLGAGGIVGMEFSLRVAQRNAAAQAQAARTASMGLAEQRSLPLRGNPASA
jgi:hypothetical protein